MNPVWRLFRNTPMIELYLPNRVITYLKKCQNVFFEALLLVGCTAILCIASLYFLDMMWHLYLETPVGHHFVMTFREHANAIEALLSVNHLYFPCELTLAVLVICLGIAAVSRFLHISSHLYLSLGICGKLLFWWLPLSALVTYYMKIQYGFANIEITFLVCSIPTLCLFHSAFRYAQELLPEFGDLIPRVISLSRWAWQKVSGER